MSDQERPVLSEVVIEASIATPQQNFTRTPFFEALNASRYARQAMIEAIEKATGRRLIVYHACVQQPYSDINQSDVAPFEDLLTDCENNCNLDLLLQTPGGDIDVAEKLVYMARDRSESFRVIVAERAKSAGTLIALASDEIVMSAISELGPIDPQVTIRSADGKPIARPANSFLDGLESIKRRMMTEGGANPAYYPLLQQLDPALIDYCEKAIERSKQFAEKWLSKYMVPDKNKAAEIASQLSDVEKFRSHGMVIDCEEAAQMGLKVLKLQREDDLWKALWRLHLHYEAECRDYGRTKIFESRKVSLPLSSPEFL